MAGTHIQTAAEVAAAAASGPEGAVVARGPWGGFRVRVVVVVANAGAVQTGVAVPAAVVSDPEAAPDA